MVTLKTVLLVLLVRLVHKNSSITQIQQQAFVIASEAWRSRRLHEIAAHPAGARNDPSGRTPSFLALDSGISSIGSLVRLVRE
jgi:hypothetical protein